MRSLMDNRTDNRMETERITERITERFSALLKQPEPESKSEPESDPLTPYCSRSSLRRANPLAAEIADKGTAQIAELSLIGHPTDYPQDTAKVVWVVLFFVAQGVLENG